MHRYSVMRYFICCFLFIQGITQLDAQVNQTDDQDTISFISMMADSAVHVTIENSEYDTLIGQVVMVQDSLFMYCDRANVEDQLYAKAYENVIIIHNDTVQIFADSMIYNGLEKRAELFGEVILQDNEKRLYTRKLDYDVANKIAYYDVGGTLINLGDTIVSQAGYYFRESGSVRFSGNVMFRDSMRTMRTDSIYYLYNLDQLNFVAPTKIDQDSIEIYAESGLYRLNPDNGILSSNVQVFMDSSLITSEILQIDREKGLYTFLINPTIFDNETIAKGDSIIYDENTRIVEIKSNAYYRSQEETIEAPSIFYSRNTGDFSTEGRSIILSGTNIITANQVVGNDQNNTSFQGEVHLQDENGKTDAYSKFAIREANKMLMYSDVEQPLLTHQLSDNELIIKADTLLLSEKYQGTDSVEQVFNAINQVKIKYESTVGRSDDFNFIQSDSIVDLWGDPVLWFDSIQLSGDTIRLHIQNDQIRQVDLINNAFVIIPDSLENHNHLKAKFIECHLINQDIEKLNSSGNAELFYLVKEGESYEAINHTKSSSMTFYFNGEDIEKIRMEGNPVTEMYKYEDSLMIEEFFLEGFVWRINDRPNDNIFVLQRELSK